MPFQKGQVANPEGGRARERKRPITQMYIQLLSDPDKLRKFCEKQLEKALEGDTVAAKDITDRVDGKPLQAIDVTDDRQSDSASRVKDIFTRAIAASRAGADEGSGSVQ